MWSYSGTPVGWVSSTFALLTQAKSDMRVNIHTASCIIISGKGGIY